MKKRMKRRELYIAIHRLWQILMDTDPQHDDWEHVVEQIDYVRTELEALLDNLDD